MKPSRSDLSVTLLVVLYQMRFGAADSPRIKLDARYRIYDLTHKNPEHVRKIDLVPIPICAPPNGTNCTSLPVVIGVWEPDHTIHQTFGVSLRQREITGSCSTNFLGAETRTIVKDVIGGVSEGLKNLGRGLISHGRINVTGLSYTYYSRLGGEVKYTCGWMSTHTEITTIYEAKLIQLSYNGEGFVVPAHLPIDCFKEVGDWCTSERSEYIYIPPLPSPGSCPYKKVDRFPGVISSGCYMDEKIAISSPHKGMTFWLEPVNKTIHLMCQEKPKNYLLIPTSDNYLLTIHDAEPAYLTNISRTFGIVWSKNPTLSSRSRRDTANHTGILELDDEEFLISARTAAITADADFEALQGESRPLDEVQSRHSRRAIAIRRFKKVSNQFEKSFNRAELTFAINTLKESTSLQFIRIMTEQCRSLQMEMASAYQLLDSDPSIMARLLTRDPYAIGAIINGGLVAIHGVHVNTAYLGVGVEDIHGRYRRVYTNREGDDQPQRCLESGSGIITLCPARYNGTKQDSFFIPLSDGGYVDIFHPEEVRSNPFSIKYIKDPEFVFREKDLWDHTIFATGGDDNIESEDRLAPIPWVKSEKETTQHNFLHGISETLSSIASYLSQTFFGSLITLFHLAVLLVVAYLGYQLVKMFQKSPARRQETKSHEPW
nr:MAG: hypothetical protein [Guiyang nephotettix cincticeps rhabdovirus 1]